MMPRESSNSYSADVQLHLLWDGGRVELAQIGPSFILADRPQDIPPCDAVILMHVDDSQRRWHVRLPFGMSKSNSRTATRPSGDPHLEKGVATRLR